MISKGFGALALVALSIALVQGVSLDRAPSARPSSSISLIESELEVSGCPNDCSGHGHCTTKNNAKVCDCTFPFHGDDCSKEAKVGPVTSAHGKASSDTVLQVDVDIFLQAPSSAFSDDDSKAKFAAAVVTGTGLPASSVKVKAVNAATTECSLSHMQHHMHHLERTGRSRSGLARQGRAGTHVSRNSCTRVTVNLQGTQAVLDKATDGLVDYAEGGHFGTRLGFSVMEVRLTQVVDSGEKAAPAAPVAQDPSPAVLKPRPNQAPGNATAPVVKAANAGGNSTTEAEKEDVANEVAASTNVPKSVAAAAASLVVGKTNATSSAAVNETIKEEAKKLGVPEDVLEKVVAVKNKKQNSTAAPLVTRGANTTDDAQVVEEVARLQANGSAPVDREAVPLLTELVKVKKNASDNAKAKKNQKGGKACSADKACDENEINREIAAAIDEAVRNFTATHPDLIVETDGKDNMKVKKNNSTAKGHGKTAAPLQLAPSGNGTVAAAAAATAANATSAGKTKKSKQVKRLRLEMIVDESVSEFSTDAGRNKFKKQLAGKLGIDASRIRFESVSETDLAGDTVAFIEAEVERKRAAKGSLVIVVIDGDKSEVETLAETASAMAESGSLAESIGATIEKVEITIADATVEVEVEVEAPSANVTAPVVASTNGAVPLVTKNVTEKAAAAASNKTASLTPLVTGNKTEAAPAVAKQNHTAAAPLTTGSDAKNKTASAPLRTFSETNHSAPVQARNATASAHAPVVASNATKAPVVATNATRAPVAAPLVTKSASNVTQASNKTAATVEQKAVNKTNEIAQATDKAAVLVSVIVNVNVANYENEGAADAVGDIIANVLKTDESRIQVLSFTAVPTPAPEGQVMFYYMESELPSTAIKVAIMPRTNGRSSMTLAKSLVEKQSDLEAALAVDVARVQIIGEKIVAAPVTTANVVAANLNKTAVVVSKDNSTSGTKLVVPPKPVVVKPNVTSNATKAVPTPTPTPSPKKQGSGKIDLNKCANRCGVYNDKATCQCDASCQTYGDCCSDRDESCPHLVDTSAEATTCANRCGAFEPKFPCQCDAGCEKHGDCCKDYKTLCPAKGFGKVGFKGAKVSLSCENRCGYYDAKATCQCDSGCDTYGDCCEDAKDKCAGKIKFGKTLNEDGTCKGHCGIYDASSACQCDEQCMGNGDCCKDFKPICPKEFAAASALNAHLHREVDYSTGRRAELPFRTVRN